MDVHVMAVVSIFLPVLMVVAILVRMTFSMKDEFDDRDTFDHDEVKVV